MESAAGVEEREREADVGKWEEDEEERRSCSVAPHRASVSCSAGGGKASPRGKDNVWSVDNDRAAKEAVRGPKHRRRRRPSGRRLPPPKRKGKDAESRGLVSGAMLVEVETVLQTQVFRLHLSTCPGYVT